MRQERPGTKKLVQFKYFLGRMEDLTKRNLGICGKADEIERQLRDINFTTVLRGADWEIGETTRRTIGETRRRV